MRRFLCLGSLLALLAGCVTTPEGPASCPPALRVAGLAEKQSNAGGKTDAGWQAKLAEVGARCESAEDGQVRITVQARFAVAAGRTAPEETETIVRLPWFVAAQGAGETILEKITGEAQVTLAADEPVATVIAPLILTLPAESLSGMRLLVGMQLTEEELEAAKK